MSFHGENEAGGANPAPAVIPVPGFLAWSYLLVGETLTLVDPGAAGVWERARAESIRVLGPSAPPIAALTATHWHVDHVGGWRHARRSADLRARLSRRIAYHLRDGHRIAYPPLPRFWGMVVNRRDMDFQKPDRWGEALRMAPVGLPLQKGGPHAGPVDDWLGDGDPVPGHPDWTVLEAPGHTIDSVCFWHESTGTLIAGDDIMGGRESPFVNRFRFSDEVMERTVERLSALNVRRLLPGHGQLLEGENLMAGLKRT